jgi:hypothetical protein
MTTFIHEEMHRSLAARERSRDYDAGGHDRCCHARRGCGVRSRPYRSPDDVSLSLSALHTYTPNATAQLR